MNNKKGFTLIELIVILGLATIVMLAVMSFFIANYRSYNRLNTESELQYQSQYIINFMTDKILEAKEYNGVAGSEYEFTYDIDDKSMIFKIEDEKLIFKDGDEPEATVGDSITGFSITTPVSPNEVLIELVLGKDNIEVEASQTVYMRNSR